MRTTADSLRRKSIRNTAINDIVKDIITLFEQDISDAATNLRTSCRVSIPSEFHIPGMSNSESQLLIYSKLIETLEDNGFTVLIDVVTRDWIISGWEIEVDNIMHDKLTEMVASRTVQARKLKKKF